jgi:hypothetical protein
MAVAGRTVEIQSPAAGYCGFPQSCLLIVGLCRAESDGKAWEISDMTREQAIESAA